MHGLHLIQPILQFRLTFMPSHEKHLGLGSIYTPFLYVCQILHNNTPSL